MALLNDNAVMATTIQCLYDRRFDVIYIYIYKFKKNQQFIRAVNGVSHSPKNSKYCLIRSRVTDFKME